MLISVILTLTDMELKKARYRYNRSLRPKQKRKWRIVLFSLLLVVLTFGSGYSYKALSAPVPSLNAEIVNTSVEDSIQPIVISWPADGQSAIGSQSDGLLAKSSDNEASQPIASMTKVITALAVLDKQPIEKGEQGLNYTITKADVDSFNSYYLKYGSIMPVREGQQLTQYQMLQGLMLPSANNIADTLAVWLFGSMDNYLAYANNLVKSYGMNNTVISDASGFSPQTVSTPSDMVIAAQKALGSPVLAEIVAQKETFIPETGLIRNTNQLLYDENVVGIKTGTTDEAGSCLVFAVKHGPDLSESLIVVLMGQPNWPATYQRARILRDSALENFSTIPVIAKGTIVGQLTSSWGDSSEVVVQDDLNIYGWKHRSYNPEIKLESFSAPIAKGTVVGAARINGREDRVELVATKEINSPSSLWRLKQGI